MNITFFLLIGWSITSILVNGSIFDSLRVYLIIKAPFFAKLMTCMQCSGFWVGFFIGLLSVSGTIYHPLEGLFSQDENYLLHRLAVLSYAFLISGTSVMINAFMISLLSKNSKDQSE